MASFAEPGWLLALPLPLIAAALVARRRRPALRYPSLALVRGLPRGRARAAVTGPILLKALAAVLLIVATAGPRRLSLTNDGEAPRVRTIQIHAIK